VAVLESFVETGSGIPVVEETVAVFTIGAGFG
jgi:hypothetical protein